MVVERRDTPDDHPYFAVARRPQVGDTVLDVAPYATVQVWPLRRDVRHEECAFLHRAAVACGNCVVWRHMAAVVAGTLVRRRRRRRRHRVVSAEVRALAGLMAWFFCDMISAPDRMAQLGRPSYDEFAALKHDYVVWSRLADVPRRAGKEHRTRRGLGIVFVHRVVPRPAHGVGNVANGASCCHERSCQETRVLVLHAIHPIARMMDEPHGYVGEYREQNNQNRPAF